MNNTEWSPGVTLDELEKAVIEKAMRYYEGNKTRTASSLGIAIRTLDNKLARYKDMNKNKEAEGERENS